MIVLLMLLSTALSSAAAVSGSPTAKAKRVALGGNTTLETKWAGRQVRVVIHSREAAEGETIVTPIQYYTRTGDPVRAAAKSTVEYLEILVDGKQIFVPSDAFWNMFDVQKAEIQATRGKSPHFTLEVTGGDAGAAYTIRLECNAKQVTRKTLAGHIVPEIAQDTRYFLLGEGDVPAIEPSP